MISRLSSFEVFFYHFPKLVSAIHYLALAGIPAAELKVSNLIIRYIQQRDQSDLFFFALRLGLFQQCNRIAPFDKPPSRKRDDMLKVVVSQASWFMTGHNVVAPLPQLSRFV